MQQRRTGTEWAQAIISWQPSWPLARNGFKPSLYGNPDCRSRLYELPRLAYCSGRLYLRGSGSLVV